MAGLIIFIVISIVGLIALLYFSSQYNESNGLVWAMFLLIAISVFSGRWHRHYIPHWNQVKFEYVMNVASSNNTHLKKQIIKYNHHDNGTAGLFFWKHKIQSKPNLANAQDDVINSTKKLEDFPTKSAFDTSSDNKARHHIELQAIKQLNTHKYVGQGHKFDQVLRN